MNKKVKIKEVAFRSFEEGKDNVRKSVGKKGKMAVNVESYKGKKMMKKKILKNN